MTEETSLSKKIRNYIVANCTYTTNNKGVLFVDNVPLKGAGAGRRFYIDVLKASRKVLKEIDEDLAFKDDKDMLADLKDYLPSAIDMVQRDIKEAYRASVIPSGKPTSLDYVMGLVPVVDLRDPKGSSKMINGITSRFSPVEHKAWANIVPPEYMKACKEQQNKCGYFEYDPRLSEAYKTIEVDGSEVDVYNRYIIPHHLSHRDRTVKIDPRFVQFFNTFFTTDESRIYATNWIYQSLFTKLEPYLVLVGAGGTGKNLLAEAIKQLHGPTNFNKAPISCLDSRFNGHLLNCTLNYYDECKFSSDKNGNSPRKNRLKDWANANAAVETKGVDSIDADIFASSIIATNNDSDIYIEQNDRKFSIMDITDTRLDKRIGVEATDWIWKYILTEEFKQGWLNWLEDQSELTFDPHKAHQGPKFDKLVRTSLANWQTELLENYILTREASSYSFKMLSENIPYMPRAVAKVNDFLRDYKVDGKDLGLVVKLDGYNHVKVSDHFAPKEEESNVSTGVE